MDERNTLARQATWAAKNIAYNLDFIPADKLAWKPAPTANSALEVVGHLLGVLENFQGVLRGEEMKQREVKSPETGEEAKTALVQATEEFVQALSALGPEDLKRPVKMRFGEVPLGFVVTMPVTDLIHHHGQIAYIQTMLGDTLPHFDMSLFDTN